MTFFFSSGSNDNLVQLWDPRQPDTPVNTLTAHLAAVKAVSWCPWQPKTLATGGGTTDRTIKFWNTASGNLLQSVDTGSQVKCLSKLDYSGDLNNELIRYSNHPNTGHVRYSNGRPWSGFRMVRFSNGRPFLLISLGHFVYKEQKNLYIKRPRLIDHLKSGPDFKWLTT